MAPTGKSLRRPIERGGKPQFSAHNVCGAGGKDRQRHIGRAHPINHLVDGAVAAARDDELAVRTDSLLRQFPCVSRACRKGHRRLDALFAQQGGGIPDSRRQPGARDSCHRVTDDDCVLQRKVLAV